MEQYYLGIDASRKFTRLMLIDDTLKIISRCKIDVAESIAEAQKKLLFKNLEDFAVVLGIGVTGARRYSLPFKTDTALSETFAIALAGRKFFPNAETIIFSGAEKYQVIIIGENNNIEDFCSVKKNDCAVLKKMKLGEPALLLGSEEEKKSLSRYIGNIKRYKESKEFFPCFGACLAARNSVGKRISADYTDKGSASEFSFKTLNCNACEKHCVVNALVYNGQIKATFGAECNNPKVYDNIYLKKI